MIPTKKAAVEGSLRLQGGGVRRELDEKEYDFAMVHYYSVQEVKREKTIKTHRSTKDGLEKSAKELARQSSA